MLKRSLQAQGELCGFVTMCSRKASLFLSMSGGCMARISREPRAPPNVCLRGTVRLPLASPLEGAVPFGEACLRLTCWASSEEVTFSQRCTLTLQEQWESLWSYSKQANRS
ncbi:hypothetical protein EYF80_016379 [Liparis tanakae]|uniref:Uncharacterized protein n=1 Tax=Liparis tanakae TaxID=230148 RepID=A0A4Z2I7J0_9TELE|nr:hypothetical protein EYF80_016379 [Liparis tanakae]